jgi:hypothetical protein
MVKLQSLSEQLSPLGRKGTIELVLIYKITSPRISWFTSNFLQIIIELLFTKTELVY